jgi:hypothetical protein
MVNRSLGSTDPASASSPSTSLPSSVDAALLPLPSIPKCETNPLTSIESKCNKKQIWSSPSPTSTSLSMVAGRYPRRRRPLIVQSTGDTKFMSAVSKKNDDNHQPDHDGDNNNDGDGNGHRAAKRMCRSDNQSTKKPNSKQKASHIDKWNQNDSSDYTDHHDTDDSDTSISSSSSSSSSVSSYMQQSSDESSDNDSDDNDDDHSNTKRSKSTLRMIATH